MASIAADGEEASAEGSWVYCTPPRGVSLLGGGLWVGVIGKATEGRCIGEKKGRSAHARKKELVRRGREGGFHDLKTGQVVSKGRPNENTKRKGKRGKS